MGAASGIQYEAWALGTGHHRHAGPPDAVRTAEMRWENRGRSESKSCRWRISIRPRPGVPPSFLAVGPRLWPPITPRTLLVLWSLPHVSGEAAHACSSPDARARGPTPRQPAAPRRRRPPAWARGEAKPAAHHAPPRRNRVCFTTRKCLLRIICHVFVLSRGYSTRAGLVLVL